MFGSSSCHCPSVTIHSRPQRPRSFWSAPKLATSGHVQRHSGFEWLCKHNRLRPGQIRFVRIDPDNTQIDGKFVNRGLPGVGLGQRSRFLVLTKRSAADGDENSGLRETLSTRTGGGDGDGTSAYRLRRDRRRVSLA